MTRRSLFAVLLAPLAKYLPAKPKANPLPAFTLAELQAAFDAAWKGPFKVETIWFSSGAVYQSFGDTWWRISQPSSAYWNGKPPFVLFDQKEVPWKTL